MYIMLAIKLGYPGMILYRRAIYGKRSPDAQRPTRLFRRPTRLSVVKEYESCEGWKIEGGGEIGKAGQKWIECVGYK